MPLKRGFSNHTIRENIRREIRSGTEPKQAIAISYSLARDAALKAGNVQRWRQLLPKPDPLYAIGCRIGGMSIGAALPPDIARMNEDQAFAELQRLDALQASRGLTPDESDRLIAVEERLEQFVPEEQLKRAEAAEKAAREGKLNVPDLIVQPGDKVQVLEEQVIRSRDPADPFFVAEVPEAKKGLGVLPIVALGALAYAIINKRGMFG